LLGFGALYAMMGVAAGLVSMDRIDFEKREGKALFFAIQLALNALWSYLFGLHNPMLAGIDYIVVMILNTLSS
jgi:tryptophan-rich sensory protein